VRASSGREGRSGHRHEMLGITMQRTAQSPGAADKEDAMSRQRSSLRVGSRRLLIYLATLVAAGAVAQESGTQSRGGRPFAPGATSTQVSPAVPPQAAVTSAPSKRPRVALALAGGGARGGAHIGVLKVLEELRVPDRAAARPFGYPSELQPPWPSRIAGHRRGPIRASIRVLQSF